MTAVLLSEQPAEEATLFSTTTAVAGIAALNRSGLAAFGSRCTVNRSGLAAFGSWCTIFGGRSTAGRGRRTLGRGGSTAGRGRCTVLRTRSTTAWGRCTTISRRGAAAVVLLSKQIAQQTGFRLSGTSQTERQSNENLSPLFHLELLLRKRVSGTNVRNFLVQSDTLHPKLLLELVAHGV